LSFRVPGATAWGAGKEAGEIHREPPDLGKEIFHKDMRPCWRRRVGANPNL